MSWVRTFLSGTNNSNFPTDRMGSGLHAIAMGAKHTFASISWGSQGRDGKGVKERKPIKGGIIEFSTGMGYLSLILRNLLKRPKKCISGIFT